MNAQDGTQLTIPTHGRHVPSDLVLLQASRMTSGCVTRVAGVFSQQLVEWRESGF
jgi:hypothetical protein